jgi:hypothetical protein
MSKIVGVSSLAVNRSIHGVNNNGTGGVNIEAVRDFYRFQLLYTKVINTLNVLLGYYSIGDFNNLNILLTEAKKNLLLTSITNNSNYYSDAITNLEGFMYDSTIFDLYKKETINTLNGLTASIEQYQYNITLVTDNEALKIKTAILDDSYLVILDYIKKKNLDLIPFTDVQMFQADLQLKPWYTEYLQKYGPPTNGVFDLTLLAGIVNTLIANGVITLDQFLDEENDRL